jgi:nucleoside-diphosphate-sugar epimerase
LTSGTSLKVLVTGGTGPFGRAVCRRLLAAGHSVTAMARNAPNTGLDGAGFVVGDVRDTRAVRTALAGCDAVVHLAWVLAPLKSAETTAEINLGGTRNILDAMAVSGCARLVFSSSVLAYGAVPGHPPMLTEVDERRPPPEHLYAAHKRAAEDMISGSGIAAVLVRAGLIAGRDVDNTIFRAFSSPVLPVPDPDRRIQFVHTDDVARFTAEAVSHNRTGAVNITGAGSLSMREFAHVINRPLIRVPERALRTAIGAAWRLGVSELAPEELGGLMYLPIVDTTRLREEWGFSCAWSSRAALEDMARALHGVLSLGKKTVRLPWRLPLGSRDCVGRLRAMLLRATYADEVDRIVRDIAHVVSNETPAAGPDGTARQQLIVDLAAHAALLARIGAQSHLAAHLVDRAERASRSATEGISR